MMMETTSFSIVRKTNITPRAMKTIHINSKYLLFVWGFEEVYVYDYKLTNIEGLPEFNGFQETFSFVNGIVDVIHSENVYVLDKKGSVFQLDFSKESTKSPDDMDIFDASPDEVSSRGQQRLIGSLENCDELLAVTEVAGGFASCTKCNEQMFVQIWILNPLVKTTEHVVTDILPCKVVLCYNKVPVSGVLKRKHFNFLQEGEQNLVLVGFSSGQVLSLPCVGRNNDKMSTVLSTPYTVSSLSWIVDEVQHTCAGLLVQFVHGAAMLLGGWQIQMLYLAGPVHTALFESSCNAYATSDGIDCIVTKLQMQDDFEDVKYECSISPLKGIRAMCTLADSKLVLVGTQHRCIYWLNVGVESVGRPTEFETPDHRLLDSLLASTVCLEKICLKMEKEDAIIRAVALAKRAKPKYYVDRFFSMQAKVYSRSCHGVDKIKIRINTSSDFVDFCCDVWQLEVIVESPELSKSEIILKKLKKPFNCDNPIVCEVETTPAIRSKIICNLLAPIEANRPWLSFHVGLLRIDFRYFLNVVDHAPKLCAEVKSVQSILSPAVPNQRIDTVLTLTLSPLDMENGIFQKLFFHSSHRMLKEQWLRLKDKDTTSVNAVIGDDVIFMRLDKASRQLKISCSNAETCHLMKKEISHVFDSNEDINLDEKTYLDAEAVRLDFEKSKLNMELDLKRLKTFKDSIRNISSRLPI